MVIVEVLVAVLTVVLVVLPARGVIRRNAIVGVRTRTTMRDDTSWQRGHQAAIIPTSVSAGVMTLVAVVCIALGRMNDVGAVLGCAAVLVAGSAWAVAAAHRAVR